MAQFLPSEDNPAEARNNKKLLIFKNKTDEFKKPVIPLLNFNPLGISPQMPRMSGLPQVGLEHSKFYKQQK